MGDELLPCPFCGTRLIKNGPFSRRNADCFVHVQDYQGRDYGRCPSAGFRLFSDDAERIALWNTRAQSQPTSGDDREEIARIIDHEGYWERLDSCNHALATVSMTDDQRRALTAVRDAELRGTASSLAKADAILARQGPGPGESVADGWVMVPREPTEAMLEELYLSPSDSGRYSAMIAATPTREGGE
ncbi:MAG: Lar family restriction alleviation protein [Proteobacteria bacterium]|nr:Lar family restriction alleviation protein [Pseudomonadota bacterium]